MKEIVENYISLLVKWIDEAERSALEIKDDAEYEDMQDRIIMLKSHWVTSKAILNLVVESER